MKRYKLELITMGDIKGFVDTVTRLPGEIHLSDGSGFCVNAKSLLGAVATVEWADLYCYSEYEIGEYIAKYCVDETDSKKLSWEQVNMFDGEMIRW